MLGDTAGQPPRPKRTEPADQFSERLLSAFLHLSPARQEEIRIQMGRRGLGGGLKAGIARMVGIRTQSLLSDMLAGRAKGMRYRKQLAELLGVSEAWLAGDDREPPDWCLPPGEAYQRLCRRVRRAWAKRCGRAAVGEGTESHEDDSSRNRLWSAWLDDHDRRCHSDEADRALIADGLGLDPADADADWLAAARYERVPFHLLARFAEWLGLPRLSHPEVSHEGHRAVQTALAHQEWLAKAMQARIERCYLPHHLFLLARRALMGEREKRQSSRDIEEIDDCLELLWRQQQRRDKRDSRGDHAVPNEFTADTGRVAWTDLRVLQHRRRLERSAAAIRTRRPER